MYRYIVETHFKKHEELNGYEFCAKSRPHAEAHVRHKLGIAPFQWKRAKIIVRSIPLC